MFFIKHFKSYEWWHLRSLGNLAFLKISYLALALVPIMIDSRLLSWLGGNKTIMFCAFFGSLFLAIANLIYDIACPIVIKRFDSPNDLYEKMLTIKVLSIKSYPESETFGASQKHCIQKYKNDSISKPKLRFTCALLFGLSAILLGTVVIIRSFSVIKAIIA